MMWPRLIPILTILTDGVYKTTQFKNPVYVGDPLNSVSLFSQLNADELIVFDISADHRRPPMSRELVSRIIDHAQLPIGFGGGLRTMDDVKKVFDFGYDKVVIRTLAQDMLSLEAIAGKFGSQALTVCIDVVYDAGASNWALLDHPEIADYEVLNFARKLEEVGVGELILQDVLREGTRQGLRQSELVDSLVSELEIPIVVSGGSKSYSDAAEFIKSSGVHSVAGGHMFLYKQPRNALLLNYPTFDLWTSYLRSTT